MADTAPTTTKQNNQSSLSEAEKFLESLNLPDASQTEATDANETSGSDPNDIMSFLDEISNYPTTNTNEDVKAIDGKKKDASNISSNSTADTNTATQPSPAPSPLPLPQQKQQQQQQQQADVEDGGGWKSWGNSFWSQASAAVKTTTDQINRSVASSDTASKLLESRVKTLQSLVNKENIEKLGTGLKNLTTTLLETVAPPISEHELVEVWLAYDMVGYTGLEALVYRAFARVMEHTESGQVVVRSNNNESTTEQESNPAHRDLNMCDSVQVGLKLAKANIDHLIKQHLEDPSEKKKSETYNPQSGAVPVIRCPVFMAIQPVKIIMADIDEKEEGEDQQFMFVIMMVDPTHNLKFKTYSQSLPSTWLDIPYEENEWVEDKMVDVIRMSVTTIAQDYVWTRMSGATTIEKLASEGQVQDV